MKRHGREEVITGFLKPASDGGLYGDFCCLEVSLLVTTSVDLQYYNFLSWCLAGFGKKIFFNIIT